MTGTVDHREGVVFKAAINSATLPTIAATTTIPAGKTWLAHGVCKLLEARETATTGSTQATSTGSGTTTNKFGTESCKCNIHTV